LCVAAEVVDPGVRGAAHQQSSAEKKEEAGKVDYSKKVYARKKEKKKRYLNWYLQKQNGSLTMRGRFG
jgi:hypothetical protein